MTDRRRRPSDRPNIAAGLPPVPLLGFDGSNSADDPATPGGAFKSSLPMTTADGNRDPLSLFGFPLHPRTNWSIPDSSLRPAPPLLCPPLNSSRTASYVCGDSSPSVVACRISDCLRRRSVWAEYDDESASALCVAADGTRFSVHLHRGGGGGGGPLAPLPDLSSGVVVECVRISGDAISFHRTCRAVLSGARGDSDGMDDGRGPMGAVVEGPLEMGIRFESSGTVREEGGGGGGNARSAASSSQRGLVRPCPDPISSDEAKATALAALDVVLELIQKDRWDARVAGMRSLVNLTDPCCSGEETSMISSLAVLGASAVTEAPLYDDRDSGRGSSDEELHRIHEWIISLVARQSLPAWAESSWRAGAEIGTMMTADPSSGKMTVESPSFDGSGGLSAGAKERTRRRRRPPSPAVSAPATESPREGEHVGALRILALRCLTNALTFLASNAGSGRLLRSFLQAPQCRHLSSDEFLLALVEHLGGAMRPPSAAGTEAAFGSFGGFGSPHDAALAARCLRLLGSHSPRARNAIRIRPEAMEALERAQSAGRARHASLEREAGEARKSLAEERYVSTERYLNI